MVAIDVMIHEKSSMATVPNNMSATMVDVKPISFLDFMFAGV